MKDKQLKIKISPDLFIRLEKVAKCRNQTLIEYVGSILSVKINQEFKDLRIEEFEQKINE